MTDLLGTFFGKCTGIAKAASLLLFAMLTIPGQDNGSTGMLPTRICISLTGSMETIRTKFTDPVIVTFRIGSFFPSLFSFTGLS